MVRAIASRKACAGKRRKKQPNTEVCVRSIRVEFELATCFDGSVLGSGA